MGGYILKRILFAIPTLIVVSIGIFLMVRLLPGDIIDILLRRRPDRRARRSSSRRASSSA